MSADSQVKSLARAMQVLECFSVEQPELGPSEIARMLGGDDESAKTHAREMLKMK